MGGGISEPKESRASMAVRVFSVATTVTIPIVLGCVDTVVVTGLVVFGHYSFVVLFLTGRGLPRGCVLYFSAAMHDFKGLLLRSTFLHFAGGKHDSSTVANCV